MASFNIHLAVAKRYIEKNSIDNIKEFYNGIIDPDLCEDKGVSHYTKLRTKEFLIPYLQNKVILPDFLENQKIDNDYKRGIFLHLITDYLFFNDFFDDSYLKVLTYNDFIKDLYYSYDYTNKYLIDKYNISLSDFNEKLENNIKKDKEEKNADALTGNNILDFNKLDLFIEKVSDIDLEKYRIKLLENGVNVLPD